MSDTTRDALAKLIDQLLGDGDTAVREFMARQTADAIVERFLVVPRSDIVGTEYAVRHIASDGHEAEYSRASRLWAVEDARAWHLDLNSGGRMDAIERPVLPWSVIPLPEDGGGSEHI